LSEAQQITAKLRGDIDRKTVKRIAADERAMRRVVMASTGVLGFISLSPTCQDRQVSVIRV